MQYVDAPVVSGGQTERQREVLAAVTTERSQTDPRAHAELQ